MMQVLTGYSKVDAISQIRFEGNVTPNSWYSHIIYSTKRGTYAHFLAIAVLSDIVYWYRASEIRDEATGATIGWKKKFSREKLQRSYKQIAEQFNGTVEQAKDACKLLSTLGLISLSFETVHRPNEASLGNVMFIDIHPEAIAAISYRPKPIDPLRVKSPSTSNHPEGSVKSPGGSGEITHSYESNQPDITETSPETSPETSFSDLEGVEKEKKEPNSIKMVVPELFAPHSHSNQSHAPSSATHGGDRSAAAKFEQNFNDRANNVLLPWRSGYGPNDWNEPILEEYVRQMDEKYPKQKHTRADGTGYFAKRERPDHPEHSVAIARSEELQQRLAARAQSKALAESTSSFNPYQPPDLEPFDPEERQRKKEEAIQTVNAARAKKQGISNGTRA